MEQVYRQILASGKKPLIVDCGANIGVSVLWFSARYPEAHIIAVEPAPDNFAFLRKNTTGLDVDLTQAGIGAADGTAWLSNPTEGEMGYITTGSVGVEIDIVSLDTLLSSPSAAGYVPFLLKVDIEGAEKSLFSGPSSLLTQFPLIVMEPHDWLFPCEGTSIPFFRFHAEAKREFAIKQENVLSIDCHPSILKI
jgi:FkbM family methyltransferase